MIQQLIYALVDRDPTLSREQARDMIEAVVALLADDLMPLSRDLWWRDDDVRRAGDRVQTLLHEIGR